LLSNIGELHRLGRPVLIGHSRKRFLEKILGRPLEERLAGTIGVAIGVAQQGVELIRVHDVQAVRDALLAWSAIVSGGGSVLRRDESDQGSRGSGR
jgi:dihydropteroate synthase